MWLFHRHRWTEVGRLWMYRPAYHPLYGLLEGQPQEPVTVVTDRCLEQGCRKFRQQILSGHVVGGVFRAVGKGVEYP